MTSAPQVFGSVVEPHQRLPVRTRFKIGSGSWIGCAARLDGTHAVQSSSNDERASHEVRKDKGGKVLKKSSGKGSLLCENHPERTERAVSVGKLRGSTQTYLEKGDPPRNRTENPQIKSRSRRTK